MKVWAVVTGVLALGGAVAGAGLLAVRAQAKADSTTNALAMAERPTAVSRPSTSAATAAGPATPTTPAASSAPAAASAAVPAPVSPDALPRAITFHQTNTYNGAIVYVPDGCHDSYDL